MAFCPLGHPDVDRIRREILLSPTSRDNFDERKSTLFLWIRIIMFLGADLSLDRLEPIETPAGPRRFAFVQPRYPVADPTTIVRMDYSTELAAEIDYEYEIMERILARYQSNPDWALVRFSPPGPSTTGAACPWPALRGDAGQTGFTRDTGPTRGELLWKYPAGHAWYARPAFKDGKVFMPSAGISYRAYCIEAETGEYVWKTPQQGGWNPYWMGYRLPHTASPAVLSAEHVIVREVGTGGNAGIAKHLLLVNTGTGKVERSIVAGHVDYRVGHAPFAANDTVAVCAHGKQEVQSKSDSIIADHPFDTLVGILLADGSVAWERNLGEFYSEPVLNGNMVFCGTASGELYCLDTGNGEILWRATCEGSLTASVTPDEGRIYAADDTGNVCAFDRDHGTILWCTSVEVDKRSAQGVTRPLVGGGCVYVGTSGGELCCLDAASGKFQWTIRLDNWIRSAPVAVDGSLYAATLSGALFKISVDGDQPRIDWRLEVSRHAILADLSEYRGDVYVVSSDLMVSNVDVQVGTVRWRTGTFETIEAPGRGLVHGDLVGGGPNYQSSATISDGLVYFGSPRFVYAIEVDSGREIWKHETRGQVCGAPAIDNGRVFFGQQGGSPDFFCVDSKTGDLIWTRQLGWVWASPHCIDGRLYVGGCDGTFWCLSQETGEAEWSYTTDESSYPVPSFYQDLVYFGSGHYYYALRRNSGELVWRFHIGQAMADSGASMVKDGIFYAQGAGSEHFFAIDALTGEELWRHDVRECNVSPATDGKSLIFSNFEGLLLRDPIPATTYCVDAQTGYTKYTLPFGGLTGAAICNDTVFSASTTDPYFRAWNLESGEIRWCYRMDGRGEEMCTAIYGNKAFALCTDGYLYAFT